MSHELPQRNTVSGCKAILETRPAPLAREGTIIGQRNAEPQIGVIDCNGCPLVGNTGEKIVTADALGVAVTGASLNQFLEANCPDADRSAHESVAIPTPAEDSDGEERGYPTDEPRLTARTFKKPRGTAGVRPRRNLDSRKDTGGQSIPMQNDHGQMTARNLDRFGISRVDPTE